MIEEEMAVNSQPTPVDNSVVTDEKPEATVDEPTTDVAERTYTKAEVIDMMRKRVNRTHQAFWNRYGVQNLGEMDELFSKVKDYDGMKEQFGEIQLKNTELMQENAYLRNNIDPQRYKDIGTYFKGLGIPFTEDALLEELKTHPEWLKKQVNVQPLGVEKNVLPQPDEKARIYKMFGAKPH